MKNLFCSASYRLHSVLQSLSDFLVGQFMHTLSKLTEWDNNYKGFVQDVFPRLSFEKKNYVRAIAGIFEILEQKEQLERRLTQQVDSVRAMNSDPEIAPIFKRLHEELTDCGYLPDYLIYGLTVLKILKDSNSDVLPEEFKKCLELSTRLQELAHTYKNANLIFNLHKDKRALVAGWIEETMEIEKLMKE